jgi:hypothetical protein
MAHLTNGDKPAKPYPDYPLPARATGRWAKRIRGKLRQPAWPSIEGGDVPVRAAFSAKIAAVGRNRSRRVPWLSG